MTEQQRGSEYQTEFRNAGTENVIQLSGEGAPGPTPTPGERLTAAEMRAETGHAPQDNPRRVGQNNDPAQPDNAEADALRVQSFGDAHQMSTPKMIEAARCARGWKG